jgi:hypothetical protein
VIGRDAVGHDAIGHDVIGRGDRSRTHRPPDAASRDRSSTMSVPELGPEERRAALAKAGEVRRIRAELKQMLKSGEVTMGQVLDRAETTEALGRMKVSEVIGSMPDYGPVTSRRLMERLEIAPTRRLRGLGPRQREALLEVFEGSS